MRRNTVFGGRVYSIVVAGLAGYVIGGWNGSVPHQSALSAAQSIALRFPQDLSDSVPAVTAAAVPTMGNAQVALLSPQPMVPQASASQASVAQAAVAQDPQAPPPQASVVQASILQTARSAAPGQAPGHQATQSVATVQTLVQLASVQTTEAAEPLAQAPAPIPAARPTQMRKANERPGFVLNDAQIASIKERLHLTPGQEEMWPAVEAALRNFAYTHLRDAKKHGAPPVQLASADPEVRDLKSAAIPLIMSFNSEQKDEVRNLAHVMGLDQLASQF
jgi:hypothetical protein